jgi:hypothetical protein
MGPILLNAISSRGSWLVSFDSLLSKARFRKVVVALASIATPSLTRLPPSQAFTQSVTSMLMKLPTD